ncbi:hypothetical protein DITRI_Ditri11bG0119900 [Diplodiscus trichospermus]
MAELYNVWQLRGDADDKPTRDHDVQPSQQVCFRFLILDLLLDDNGYPRQSIVDFKDESYWIRSIMLSSISDFIAGHLREAGIHDHDVERVVNGAYAEITSILNKEENSKLDIVMITLTVDKGKYPEREAETEEEDIELEEAMTESSLKPVPATKESIQALRKVKLGDTDHSVSRQMCTICFEEFSEHAMDIASMPCSHLFHENCVVKWLNTIHLCPLYRFPMPKFCQMITNAVDYSC